jgi:hypothetical protein
MRNFFGTVIKNIQNNPTDAVLRGWKAIGG